MRHTHFESGGRYPVLRTLAILYLVGAAVVLAWGIWRATYILVYGQSTDNFFGEPAGWTGRLFVAASWLAVSFFTVLAMVAIAELVKLFIDIEHNTRLAAERVSSNAGAASTAAVGERPIAAGGAAAPGGRLAWVEGEETAESALLKGH